MHSFFTIGSINRWDDGVAQVRAHADQDRRFHRGALRRRQPAGAGADGLPRSLPPHGWLANYTVKRAFISSPPIWWLIASTAHPHTRTHNRSSPPPPTAPRRCACPSPRSPSSGGRTPWGTCCPRPPPPPTPTGSPAPTPRPRRRWTLPGTKYGRCMCVYVPHRRTGEHGVSSCPCFLVAGVLHVVPRHGWLARSCTLVLSRCARLAGTLRCAPGTAPCGSPPQRWAGGKGGWRALSWSMGAATRGGAVCAMEA